MPDQTQLLLYVILTGIMLVLCVMVAITCLLVHHNRNIRHLQQEASAVRSRSHTRRATLNKGPGQGKLDDDGYVAPRQATHPMHPPDFRSPQAPMYITQSSKPYENISLDSESGHSYESMGNFQA